MTGDEALHTKHGSTVKLLLQFALPKGPTFECAAAQRITQVVRGLGLPPAVKKRIEQTVIETLRETRQGEIFDLHRSAISIRVWISALSTTDPFQPDSELRVCSAGRGGWGFFLLQRPESDQGVMAVESAWVLELYLYEEGMVANSEGAREQPDAF